MLRMSKSSSLSDRRDFSLLCCLQCCHCSSSPWYRNGTT
nr:hypothetical protein [Tanacetum cinerariifolium]